MQNHIHGWAFEAGSIQTYLFDTGRLADAVGASALVDRLTGDLDQDAGQATDLLTAVLQAVGAADSVRFSRRGGGSFIAFFTDAALLRRARGLWHAALAANAPGLRWADGVAEAADERNAAQAALNACKVASQIDSPQLPEPHAAALRVPRTGRVAADFKRIGAKGLEPLDAPTMAKREHGAAAKAGVGLLKKFGGGDLVWPTNMEAGEGNDDDRYGAVRFPFNGADRDVAFLHADGNGLGVLLTQLAKLDQKSYLSTYAQFSRAVSRATVAAAKQATDKVLLPQMVREGLSVVPARPLILGGDDLSIVVRADLALPFAEAFLKAFEQATQKELAPLKKQLGDWTRLTAACGIAFVKASYPFSAAAHLAESLCKRAKEVIKAEAQQSQPKRVMPLAALAFQRVTTSMAEVDLPVVTDAEGPCQLGLKAYVLPEGQKTSLPTLAQLNDLAAALRHDDGPRGAPRRMMMEWHDQPDVARETYRRMRSVEAGIMTAERSKKLSQALQALRVPEQASLPALKLDTLRATPWPDALLLNELQAQAALALQGDQA